MISVEFPLSCPPIHTAGLIIPIPVITIMPGVLPGFRAGIHLITGTGAHHGPCHGIGVRLGLGAGDPPGAGDGEAAGTVLRLDTWPITIARVVTVLFVPEPVGRPILDPGEIIPLPTGGHPHVPVMG